MAGLVDGCVVSIRVAGVAIVVEQRELVQRVHYPVYIALSHRF